MSEYIWISHMNLRIQKLSFIKWNSGFIHAYNPWRDYMAKRTVYFLEDLPMSVSGTKENHKLYSVTANMLNRMEICLWRSRMVAYRQFHMVQCNIFINVLWVYEMKYADMQQKVIIFLLHNVTFIGYLHTTLIIL